MEILILAAALSGKAHAALIARIKSLFIDTIINRKQRLTYNANVFWPMAITLLHPC